MPEIHLTTEEHERFLRNRQLMLSDFLWVDKEVYDALRIDFAGLQTRSAAQIAALQHDLEDTRRTLGALQAQYRDGPHPEQLKAEADAYKALHAEGKTKLKQLQLSARTQLAALVDNDSLTVDEANRVLLQLGLQELEATLIVEVSLPVQVSVVGLPTVEKVRAAVEAVLRLDDQLEMPMLGADDEFAVLSFRVIS